MRRVGASNDLGRLGIALLRRPGTELREAECDPLRVLWNERPDQETAYRQHSILVNTLLETGVTVIEIAGRQQYPNLCFCRDQIVTLPKSVLLAKPATACREGEIQLASSALHNAGIMPVPSVSGIGPYEGGDFILVEDGTMLAGCSNRTSLKAIRGLGNTFADAGVSGVVPIAVPQSFLHLDCAMLPIGNRRLVAAFELDRSTHRHLERGGFRVLRIAEEWTGQRRLGLNVLFIRPGLALVSDQISKPLLELLHQEGITTRKVPISEFEKGGGGVHCLVATILRGHTV